MSVLTDDFGFTCQDCGCGTVQDRIITEYQTKVKGHPIVIKDARVGICDHCGAEYFSPRETARWEQYFDREQDHLYMQPKEIRDLQELLGLSMEQFSALIGCTRQSLYNWQRTDRRSHQSRMADVLLRLAHRSCQAGPVDVLSFLVDEAARFGFTIEPRCTAPRVLLQLRPRLEAREPDHRSYAAPSPVRMAAHTAKEEKSVRLYDGSDCHRGDLEYDFRSGTLRFRAHDPFDWESFKATVYLSNGEQRTHEGRIEDPCQIELLRGEYVKAESVTLIELALEKSVGAIRRVARNDGRS